MPLLGRHRQPPGGRQAHQRHAHRGLSHQIHGQRRPARHRRGRCRVRGHGPCWGGAGGRRRDQALAASAATSARSAFLGRRLGLPPRESAGLARMLTGFQPRRAVLVFACGLLAALTASQPSALSRPQPVEKGREIAQPEHAPGPGAGYDRVGEVFRDPVSGKLVLIEAPRTDKP